MKKLKLIEEKTKTLENLKEIKNLLYANPEARSIFFLRKLLEFIEKVEKEISEAGEKEIDFKTITLSNYKIFRELCIIGEDEPKEFVEHIKKLANKYTQDLINYFDNVQERQPCVPPTTKIATIKKMEKSILKERQKLIKYTDTEGADNYFVLSNEQYVLKLKNLDYKIDEESNQGFKSLFDKIFEVNHSEKFICPSIPELKLAIVDEKIVKKYGKRIRCAFRVITESGKEIFFNPEYLLYILTILGGVEMFGQISSTERSTTLLENAFGDKAILLPVKVGIYKEECDTYILNN